MWQAFWKNILSTNIQKYIYTTFFLYFGFYMCNTSIHTTSCISYKYLRRAFLLNLSFASYSLTFSICVFYHLIRFAYLVFFESNVNLQQSKRKKVRKEKRLKNRLTVVHSIIRRVHIKYNSKQKKSFVTLKWYRWYVFVIKVK